MSLFLFDKIKGGNKNEFANKVKLIAQNLGIKADWLMIVMNFESGINSTAVNSTSGATGLIQFIPSTAKALGTTTTDLYNMTNVQQLDYVYLYLSKYKGKLNNLSDLYLAIFYPNAIGKSDDYILGTTEENKKLIAKRNAILDTNKNGYIQKKEVVNYINNYANKLGYSTSLNFGVEKKN